jgi:hypothetical protein
MDSDHSGIPDRFTSQSDEFQHENALPWESDRHDRCSKVARGMQKKDDGNLYETITVRNQIGIGD